jgi:FkbM family methyltransferase
MRSKFVSLIKNLKFQGILVSVVRALHLSSPMKNLYFRLFAPKNGLKTLELEGFEARFRVNSYTELHALDTVFSEDAKAEDEVIKAMFEIVQPGDTVYDIGANMGIHSVFMSLKVGEHGQVISFEPENRMYEALRKNIRVNKLNNITPLKIALGDRNETKILYGKQQVGTGAFSLIEGEESEVSQEVGVFSGDYIVKRDGLPLPKAVKIDVEGFEFFVLRGLKETLSSEVCRFVFCEIHPKLLGSGVDTTQITEFLQSVGFIHIRLRERGEEIHAFCYKD